MLQMACMRACSSSASDQGAGALASPIRGSCTSKSSATSRRPGAAAAAPARARAWKSSTQSWPPAAKMSCAVSQVQSAYGRSFHCRPPASGASARRALQVCSWIGVRVGQVLPTAAAGRAARQRPPSNAGLGFNRRVRKPRRPACGRQAGAGEPARRGRACTGARRAPTAGTGGGPRLAARPARPRPPAMPGSDTATLRRQQARGAAFL